MSTKNLFREEYKMDFNGNKDNGQKEAFRPTVYSSVSLQNPTGKVEKSRLGISYWKGLMKLSFAIPKANDNNSEFTSWDMDNAQIAYLTPHKALILAKGIERVIDGTDKNYGVTTKNGILFVGKGDEIGISKDEYVLIIQDVDSNGVVTASSAYEFNTDFHFGIHNYDSKKMSFDKEVASSIFELNIFKDNLIAFANATNNAVAAAVCDSWQVACGNFITKKLDAISDKLGIERPRYGNSNSSFFNSGNSSSGSKMNTGSTEPVEDLESMLSDLDI